ncbi:glutamate receptor ionotropic, kainate 2-like isoform X2 [Ptychodera flava]|uniref:glutamate receptor ionotropic, kainate 2-like isoform X2 n=1 Tax=Ptychodera flava TaxID=63121 RepID=UPI00396A8C6F
MRAVSWIALLGITAVLSSNVPPNVPSRVRIGGIFSREGSDLAEEAFHLAIEHVNGNPNILPFTNLTAKVRQSDRLVNQFGNIQNACHLISKGVAAIVGPTTSTDVKAVYPVADGLHIPHFAPFATDPTLSQNPNRYTYLFKMSAPDSIQSQALIDIISHFHWSRMAILTSMTDYGINGVIELQRIAIQRNWVITHVGRFLPTINASSVDAREQLAIIRSKGVRLVILNCLANYARYVLRQAAELGMMQTGWAWIVTDGVTAIEGLYEDCLEIPPHLIGVLGTRPTIDQGELYDSFRESFSDNRLAMASKKFQVNHHCEDQFNMASVMRTYDAVIAFAAALHNYLEDGNNFTHPNYSSRTCSKNDTQKWENGEKLMKYIQNVNTHGTMNYINFTKLNTPWMTQYDIVNLGNRGFVKVGEWYEPGKLDFFTSRVFFPGNTKQVPLDTNLDLSNYTLKITTILDEPFVMLTEDKTKKGNDRFRGFCKDLLDKLQTSLKFKYEMSLVPDGQYGARDVESDSWNGMVSQLIDGRADVAVASLTISYERQQYIAFTKPYLDLGLTILMKVKEPSRSLFAFLDPFSYDLWMAILLAMIFSGMCVAVCSYLSPYGYYGAYVQRENPHDNSADSTKSLMNLYNALWFSFASWMQQGADVNPRSISGRIVGGFWWMAVIIITANYTANLAAFLTVARMTTGISSLDDLAKQTAIPYGTVKSSQPESYFAQADVDPYRKISNFMMQFNTNVNDTKAGVDKVQQGNFAFIWDSAILEYAANKEPCDVQTVGRLFGKMGYGLGLPLHSHLTDIFSLEILKLRQSGYIEQLSNRYFTGICDKDKKTSTEKAGSQMSINNMLGVFYFLFAGFGFGFLVMLGEWFWASYKESTSSKPESSRRLSWCQAVRRRLRATSRNIQRCGCKTKDEYNIGNNDKRVTLNQHFVGNREFPRAKYETVPQEDFQLGERRRKDPRTNSAGNEWRANGPHEVTNTVSVY